MPKLRILIVFIIIAAVPVVTLSSFWGLSSPQGCTVSLSPPGRQRGGEVAVPDIRVGLAAPGPSPGHFCPLLRAHRPGRVGFVPSLGLFISCSLSQLRDTSVHLGILLVFCSCVGRVINTLGIELKLVTGTNSIHSIVIHAYFLRPVMCQMLCWR